MRHHPSAFSLKLPDSRFLRPIGQYSTSYPLLGSVDSCFLTSTSDIMLVPKAASLLATGILVPFYVFVAENTGCAAWSGMIEA